MPEYAVFLRGVMPTGKNKVAMGPFREALKDQGFKNVRTYIQSGNALVQTPLSKSSVEGTIHRIIQETFGGDIAVIALKTKELRILFHANPFPKAPESHLYFTFLGSKPSQLWVEEFKKQDIRPNKIIITDEVIYHYCPTRYSDSKVNNNIFERKLKIPCTTRISRTVAQVLNLAEQI